MGEVGYSARVLKLEGIHPARRSGWLTGSLPSHRSNGSTFDGRLTPGIGSAHSGHMRDTSGRVPTDVKPRLIMNLLCRH